MLNVGDTFGPYTLEAVIGEGGMGRVFRARDARLDRRVAVKILPDAAEGDARILREARAAAALDHPNVVAIHDVGEHDGAPYVVMEHVTGRTLRAAVGDGTVPAATRVGWLTDVARALSAAHRRGLVHRDVKPENVMVREDGVVKVLDFGIARTTRAGLDPGGPTQPAALATATQGGLLLGTPLYMAPEQLRGEPLDGRADQFAWGVLAHELLTGRTPWRGGSDPIAVIASVLTDRPDLAALEASGAPPQVRRAILRALSKRPEERFSSMDELLASLDEPAPAAEPAQPADRARAVPQGSSPSSSALPSPTLAARYSTADVRAILERAVDRQSEAGGGRFGFDELEAAAREAGIDEAVLREASHELRASREAPTHLATYEAWSRKKRRALYRHLGAFMMVNGAMFVLGVLVHALPFTLIPGVLWAIGLGIHAVNVFTSDQDEWREERDRRARRRERRRTAASDRELDEGAALLLRTGAERRKRVAPAPAGEPRERLRLGSQAADDEHALEQDALAAHEAGEAEEAERAARAQRRSRR